MPSEWIPTHASVAWPTTRAYVAALIRRQTPVAIVEAIELAHLSVRVPSQHVDAVRDELKREMPLGWFCDVSALGYVEPFVRDIYVFA